MYPLPNTVCLYKETLIVLDPNATLRKIGTTKKKTYSRFCTFVSMLWIEYIAVLVGAWPCGNIVMISGSESKSKVYGHIHTFLQDRATVVLIDLIMMQKCYPLLNDGQTYNTNSIKIQFYVISTIKRLHV